MRAGRDLCHRSRQPAEQVERGVPQRIHRIFDLGTKGPQEHHVANDVRPTAVHEHRSENRDQVMAANNLGGDQRPLGHERRATRQL
jgi:hypothetical protein